MTFPLRSETACEAIPIIDIDTHFAEPPDLWAKRAPARFRETAPRVKRKADGVDAWFVGDDDLEMGPLGYCVIRPDASKQPGTLSLDTLEELHPGATHAAPRLAVMDQHGIDVQILYPNILGFAGDKIMEIKDEALRLFCITAYNDACADLKAEGGGRLLPQFLLPFWDMDLAVKEMDRCFDRLGLNGFVIPSAPEMYGLPNLSRSWWNPLLARAQERGAPINFHIGGGGVRAPYWRGMNQVEGIVLVSTLAHLGNLVCVANLICSGLLDRFPSLNFVSVESGLGWLPFLLELMEYQFDENGSGRLQLRPREYFQRQIYASFWFESDVAGAVAKLGSDNIMFETDFPHPTCLYPSIQDHIATALGPLAPDIQRKLLFENAARVYGIELPA